jgi:hypothetical protein
MVGVGKAGQVAVEVGAAVGVFMVGAAVGVEVRLGCGVSVTVCVGSGALAVIAA